jgi:hypothetical protein
MRLTKPFSVSIGSCSFSLIIVRKIYHTLTKTELYCISIPYTSTEHEMEMLPTTFPGTDGSKRLNVSMSESESCTIIYHSKWKCVKWIMLKGQRRSWYFNKSNICDFLKKKKAKFLYLGQKFKQINLTVSNKSIAGQFVGLHEREKSNLDTMFEGKGPKVITVQQF